jgi:hypothetical protein
MNTNEKIIELNNARTTLLNDINNIKNNKKRDKLYKENEPKIDSYEKDILNLMKLNFDDFEFDLMLEQLSFLGWCPCLINDDNGHWAITCEGFSSISEEIADWNGAFIIEKKYWKNTPREALKYILIEDTEEDDTCYDPPLH